MIRLGVNIDHVATVREARRIDEPNPAWAVVLCELGGADQITLHLREDRRHIRDHDLVNVLRTASVPVNLEMAITDEMLRIAMERGPSSATLVPERREEITTEGGLDVAGNHSSVVSAVRELRACGMKVSLFVDPDGEQVRASAESGADAVELHTGAFCEAFGSEGEQAQLTRLRDAAALAHSSGLAVHAGHGLNVRNVRPVAAIPSVVELNIGHSIVGRSIFVGLQHAVAEMKAILAQTTSST